MEEKDRDNSALSKSIIWGALAGAGSIFSDTFVLGSMYADRAKNSTEMWKRAATVGVLAAGIGIIADKLFTKSQQHKADYHEQNSRKWQEKLLAENKTDEISR